MTKKKIIKRSNSPLTYGKATKTPPKSDQSKYTNQFDIGGALSGVLGKIGGIMGGNKLSASMGGAVSALGNATGLIGGGLIGGGLLSGAGSAISNIGGTIGGAVGAINPLLGGVISAGSGIIGGLTNRAFGSKMNQEKINDITTSNNAVNLTMVDSSSNDSVASQWSSMNLGNDFTKKDVGSDGWFSHKAANKYKELALQLGVARNRAMLAFGNAANTADTNMDLTAMRNFSAYGGPIEIATQAPMAPFGNRYANGGPLDKAKLYKLRLEKVRGPMNNDYDYAGYYAKYPTLAEAILKGNPHAHFTDEFKLPNHSTFSDESIYSQQRGGGKVLGGHWDFLNGHDTFLVSDDNFNNNPNLGDYFLKVEPNSIPIYKGGTLLPEVTVSGNRFAEGGDISSNGANWSDGVTLINSGGTHEENPNQGVLIGVDDQGTPNLVEEGEVKWNDYIFSNRLTTNKSILEKTYLPTSLDNHTFAAAAEKLGRESKERPNDPISQRGLKDSLTKLESIQEAIKLKEQQRVMKKDKKYAYGGNLFANGGYEMPFVKRADGTYPIEDNTGIGTYGKDWGPVGQHPYSLNPNLVPMSKETWVPPFRAQPHKSGKLSLSDTAISDAINDKLFKSATDTNLHFTLPTNTKPPIVSSKNSGLANLRFAPAIGSGMMALSDAFGWTNKPNYSSADSILDSVSHLKPVTYTPLGNYLKYTPFDRNYYTNKLGSQASATKRSIVNQAGGNRATATAGLLAADYNAQDKLGDLFRLSEEYNQGLKERVETFNRGTDLYNSESSTKTQIANLANDRLRFEAAIQAAGLRDQADARSASARSANLSNLFDNLGGIGVDAYNRNDRNSLIKSGVFGALNADMLKNSGMSKSEIRGYFKGLGLSDDEIKARGLAMGGKLKRKKGLTC